MTSTLPAEQVSSADVSYRRIVSITWPMIVSSSTTPLLGLVDTAVIGNLGSAAYLGAIALGALLMNFIFWGFGFLRMGTTGFTAQAMGATDDAEIRASLWRGGLLGLGLGCVLILLQWPMGLAAFALLSGSAEVESLARTYFHIRIWGAPSALILYVMTGWFIGLQNPKYALYLQLFLNGLNIVLDILFVTGFGWGVAGVAFGTMIAETVTVVFGLFLVAQEFSRRGWSLQLPALSSIAQSDRISKLLSVNVDIFIRTMLLVFSFSWFTAQSATMGDVTIAANYILMQFFLFSAYFLDGFAFSAEALVGSAIGARSRAQLITVTSRTTQLAGLTAVLLSVIIAVCGPYFIATLTTAPEVRVSANQFLIWAAIMPATSVWCYQLDGIFIGAIQTKDMRNMAIISTLTYLGVHHLFVDAWGNHGLWAAFIIYQSARGITLALRLPHLVQTKTPDVVSN